MYLGELINTLAKQDPSKVLPHGFRNPHSYRGTYAELAFEPCENVSIGEMLAAAQNALGQVFPGYKGGDFKMTEYTPVHLANYGCCGEEIGAALLGYMLRAA